MPETVNSMDIIQKYKAAYHAATEQPESNFPEHSVIK